MEWNVKLRIKAELRFGFLEEPFIVLNICEHSHFHD